MRNNARARRAFSAAILVAALSAIGIVTATPAQAAAVRPVVTKISAAAGPVKGGIVVTIAGRNLAHVTAVDFGTAKGTRVRVLSSRKLSVKVPPHRAGTVDVHIVGQAGASRRTKADRFAYLAVPTVSALSAIRGTVSGGTSLTVTGSGFRSGQTKVRFGTVTAGKVSVRSASSLTVKIPKHKVGTVDVTVLAPGGASKKTASDRYSYAASLAAGNLDVFADKAMLLSDGSLAVTNTQGPDGLATDSTGNVYVADGYKDRVERITPGGKVTVVAGNGTYGYPITGKATRSPLGSPSAIALDAAGDLYIADYNNGVVEKVSAAGMLSVVAGDGTNGALTLGPATSTHLAFPEGVAVSPSGDLYIADTGANLVVKLGADGKLSAVAGFGILYPNISTPAASTKLISPSGLAFDSAGNLYISDSGHRAVEQVTPGGELSPVAGNGALSTATAAGPALSAALGYPVDVTVDAADNIYIADVGHHLIEKVTPDGTLSVVAGTTQTGTPIAGPALASPLQQPAGVAVGGGFLYIADEDNYAIERVALS